jgi:hypothetical protein
LSTGASDHARSAFFTLQDCITVKRKKAQIPRLTGPGFTKVSTLAFGPWREIVVAVVPISD